MDRMSLKTRGCPGAGMLIAGLLILLPTGPRAETSPPPLLPPSITEAIDAVASRADQCPNEEALQSLVEEAQSPTPHRADAGRSAAATPARKPNDPAQGRTDPARVVAVATYAAERLRASGWGAARGQEGDSQCSCIERLSTALTPADPKSGGDIHKVFADAFPNCDKEDTLSTRDASSRGSLAPDSRLPEWKSLPEFGLFGDPTPICKRDCSAVEPPPANDASRTAL